MRKTPLLLPTALLAVGLALAGCSSPTDSGTNEGMQDSSSESMAPNDSMAPEDSMDEDEAMNSDAMAEVSGMFEGLGDKSVAGTATLSGDALTLSGFSSDEGPDLHVYLTNGVDEEAVTAGMRIDAVAFDQESQTFALDGVDPSTYTHVVIHCDKAKAVFGAAALS
ncbi:DM13 domain-containing protein [Microbacterium pseudoresistens]|uniref:ABC-type oligopeptide transport system substrate-binding subunit n=1 Tax=Microbacterium pseudoresistens TaxID=640634 RepID=A0A7Y9EUZ1_9MICO|nr:DM13 domain-containing protein [Microbacterium pseudoresistens]NYD54304.1 ABC-type oligopeptide transport system substrate-binding subunit [Microbacterium pseudoresistens]